MNKSRRHKPQKGSLKSARSCDRSAPAEGPCRTFTIHYGGDTARPSSPAHVPMCCRSPGIWPTSSDLDLCRGGTGTHAKAEGTPGTRDPCRGDGTMRCFLETNELISGRRWGGVRFSARGGAKRINAGSWGERFSFFLLFFFNVKHGFYAAYHPAAC